MPSEAKCAKILMKMRWEDGIYCPRCKSKRVVKFSPYARRKSMHRYLCRHCRRTFTDTTGRYSRILAWKSGNGSA